MTRPRVALTPLEETMGEMTAGYLRMRAEGVSREDACNGIEEVLRSLDVLRLSKFSVTCDACDDSGWISRRCTHEMRCSREKCRKAHPAHEHAYVERCGCRR